MMYLNKIVSMTEPELLDKICGLLGGRVSEDIMKYQLVHQMTSKRATQIARSMVWYE